MRGGDKNMWQELMKDQFSSNDITLGNNPSNKPAKAINCTDNLSQEYLTDIDHEGLVGPPVVWRVYIGSLGSLIYYVVCFPILTISIIKPRRTHLGNFKISLMFALEVKRSEEVKLIGYLFHYLRLLVVKPLTSLEGSGDNPATLSWRIPVTCQCPSYL